jgi:hypothetical protein
MFCEGFHKTATYSSFKAVGKTIQRKREAARLANELYSPSDEMMNGPALRNVSGSDKVASAGMHLPQAPKEPVKGLRMGLRQMSVAKRVTPNIGAYGAPKGANDVFGKTVSRPFQQSYGKFGRRPRMAIKSFTRLKRGF